MWWGIVPALLAVTYVTVIVDGVSLDLVITKEVEEVIKKDVFLLSFNDVKPGKHSKKTKETLLSIVFPGSRDKLSLMIEREAKKVIVETIEDGWRRTQHFLVDTLHDKSTVNSVILRVNQTKPRAHISLYIDCTSYGKVATPKSLREMFSSMETPKIEVFHERKYKMKVDDPINWPLVLSKNGCPPTLETEAENIINKLFNDDSLDNNLMDDPNVIAYEVEDLERGDTPIKSLEDAEILKALNSLIKIVNLQVKRCGDTARSVEEIRRLIASCNLCQAPQPTCATHAPNCYPGHCRDTDQGPRCESCPPGLIGDGQKCIPPPIRIRTCSEDNPCYPGVTCTDGPRGPVCGHCPVGYEGDGKTCSRKVPPTAKCSEHNPCFPGVICRDDYYEPKCGPCPDKYEGDGKTCRLIPTRKCSDYNPCPSSALCRDGPKGPECHRCPSGYKSNGRECVPARPKCEEHNPCFSGVACRDGPDGTECGRCPDGYEGDGRTCRRKVPPIVRCSEHNPCYPGVTCRDDYYEPKCGSCPDRYEGDGKTCRLIPPRRCSEYNPCPSSSTCRDTPEGPVCQRCPHGFKSNGRECLSPKCSENNPCYPGVVCRDGPSGPECLSCPEGYEGDGRTCTPHVVRCSEHNPCFPGVICRDDYYGPTCDRCPENYEGDGKTCTKKKNVCEEYYNPCSSGNKCVPTDTPPYYTCRCPEGTKWDGVRCVDINECELVQPCDPLVECINLNPGYRCGPCPWGYTGSLGVQGAGIDFAIRNKQVCTDINECLDESTCGPRECTNTEGSYICGCKYINQTCEWRPKETLCPSGHKCHSKAECSYLGFGQYACKCVTGWAGNGTICGRDTDLDSWPDENLQCSDEHCQQDNCPSIPNSGQEDTDKDLQGDACDTDSDGDDINKGDNCPFHYNPRQNDMDGDSIGDECDNCPRTENRDQHDTDQDGLGDVCDGDIDGDGFLNEYDNCPNIANDQIDTDGDGIGDACDNCQDTPNRDQQDSDQNLIGDSCDSSADRDRDGVPDYIDNCMDTPNPSQLDTDRDGKGNECDEDDDDDGYIDVLDNCKLVANPDQTDSDGDGRGDICDTDYDQDETEDYKDNCPNNSLIYRTDFRTYQMVALDPVGTSQVDPNWEVYNDGAEIVQTLNSDPGLAVGYDVLFGVDYEGTVFVDSDEDNDFLGIIFSYQSNKKFYTVMWKKNAQAYWKPTPFRAEADPGIQIKAVNSETGPSEMLRNSLWHNRDVANQTEILWRDPNNEGWKPRTPYRWILIHRPSIGLIRLKIFNGEQIVTDSGNIFDNTHKGGRLGVLCFSQQMIIWSDLVYRCNENLKGDIWRTLPPNLRKKIDIDVPSATSSPEVY